MKIPLLILAAVILGLGGCSTVYYGTMEKLGVHKRDIMVDRVKAARDTQNEAKQQFLTAMEQFKSVVNFKGGDLEKEYNKLNATLQKSESEAAAVRDRISAVENVSDALFSEWRSEIKQCGGRIVAVYVTMGKTDLLAITEFPGVAEAMKASVALNKALGISFATVPALPVEDFDKLVAGKA